MKEDRLPTLQYLDWPTLENVCSECSEIEREVLDAINREVAGAPSLDDVMNFMFDAFRKIGDCDRLSVAFLEEDNQRVVSHWTRTVYDDTHLTKGYSEDLRGSSLAHVLASGKPRVIGDMTQYLREHSDSRSTQLLVREGLHSSMTCPLIVEHRPVGFLFRSSLNANAYDEHQVRMHLAVAERLNQAVEKAYRIEQLAAANQAYFETLGFVSHELRSPLSSLVMDGEFLLSGIFGEMAEKQRDKVARMVEHGRYLLSLIDGYMDLAQVESHAMDTAHEEIDFVNAVVLDAVQTVQPQFEARRIVFTQELPDEPLEVTCDRALMRIVLTNLLTNAAKYSDEGGTVRLRVQRTGTGFGLSVWNSGPGFPAAERKRLFRKFSRLQSPELLKRKGSGIGLYTTWRIVQLHGGRIRGESEEGRWAEFSVAIPQPPANRTWEIGMGL